MSLLNLYLNKKKPFPVLSILFVLTNILFSVCVIIKPNSRYIFTGLPSFGRFWKIITPLFVHGENPPIIIHLIGNCLVILLFGVLVEKYLGHFRFFLLSLSSYIVTQLTVMIIFHDVSSGASLIAWSYSPFVLPVLFAYFKLNGKQAFKSVIFDIQIFYLFFIWIVITVLSIIQGATGTVTDHIVSTFIGFMMLVLWGRKYKSSLFKPDDEKVKRDRLKMMLSLSTIYLVAVLIACFQLAKIDPVAKVLKITPASGSNIEEINSHSKSITVIFDREMDSDSKFSLHYSFECPPTVKDYGFKTKWESGKTLVIKFSNSFSKGQKLEITLTKLRNLEGDLLTKKIKIHYE